MAALVPKKKIVSFFVDRYQQVMLFFQCIVQMQGLYSFYAYLLLHFGFVSHFLLLE